MLELHTTHVATYYRSLVLCLLHIQRKTSATARDAKQMVAEIQSHLFACELYLLLKCGPCEPQSSYDSIPVNMTSVANGRETQLLKQLQHTQTFHSLP